MSNLRKFTSIFAIVLFLFSPLTSVLDKAFAATNVDQSIEACFVAIDNDQKILSKLPDNTTIQFKIYTDPGYLKEGQINSYGTTSIPISQTSSNLPNKDLVGNDGINDSYCAKYDFQNPTDHEYTYTQATITSNLDWLPIRYNDENTINFVDPDIAFPYSNEWFDNIAGNESQRNTQSDGHIVMDKDRLNRRIVIVSQLDKNLPKYAVKFSDSTPATQEYTLSTVPNSLDPNSSLKLRFGVQNMGTLLWESGENGSAVNPVNVSYHWKKLNDGTYTIYEGNRALLNQNLKYSENDNNIALTVNTPSVPGNYELIIDLVHEGVTWFSQKGADTKVISISIQSSTPVSAQVEPVQTPVTQPVQTVNQQSISIPKSATQVRTAAPSVLAATTGQTIYTVQPPRTWDPSWHCGGYDCLRGIAEDYYHCSANGIPNDVPNTTNVSILSTKCWWPIYQANLSLYQSSAVPALYQSQPWNYIQVGWQLVIPNTGGTNPPPPPPAPPDNYNGIPGSSPADPYAGMNGAYSPWPQVAFDRFITWDGSAKFDQIKWSETQRPPTPTITSVATNSTNNTVTIFGVAIPKNHPMNVRVWNEYRYCWACGSAWEYFYQQGSAQHVKVVIFKEGWQYLGEVWNDRSDGRWSLTLPLSSSLKPGDKIMAEVQVESDFTFSNLHWWWNTTETVKFDLRNPKYFGFPYFGSGGSNLISIPSLIVDTRSFQEKEIDNRAFALGSTGGSALTTICSVPGKYYSNLLNNQPGAIVYINNRTVYSFGGTWDTFSWYGDKCDRFGAPIDDPHTGGNGPFNTPGAYQDFQKGRIYWSWKYLGKFTYGTIWNKFEQAGGTNSSYGWPKSETYSFTQNGKSTICQNFEGGTICMEDIPKYTEAQLALMQALGREVLTSEINRQICGGREVVTLPDGIIYYDPFYKNVRRITGEIYKVWGENCAKYGLPENDTTNVYSVTGKTGEAQRYNNTPLIFDFYHSDLGLIILEGTARNLYESLGGLGSTGFPKRVYSDYWTGICVETEKTTICEKTKPQWAIQLQAKVEQLNQTFDPSKVLTICNNDTYKAYPLTNPTGIAYYDPVYNNTNVITGQIYTKWNEDGACDKYGLPENPTTAVTSYTGKTGYAQRFHKDNLIYDFYYSDLGTFVLEGIARNLYESHMGLGGTGFPKQVYTDPNRGVCVATEKELICEKPAPDTPACGQNEKWNGTQCVDLKTYECNQKGMIKYTNPNNSNDVTCAKINYAPYINQWLSSDGKTKIPDSGSMHCSAASSVMALGGLGKIKENNFDNLKKFVYQDSPFTDEKIILDKSQKSCPSLEGAFSYTAIEVECNQGIWWRIQAFMKQFGVKSTDFALRTADSNEFYKDLKKTIDSNGFTIQGVGKGDIAHIILLKGYTDDNLDGIPDRMIVNDSFRNLAETGSDYNLKGNGAIYKFNSDGIVFYNYYDFNL